MAHTWKALRRWWWKWKGTPHPTRVETVADDAFLAELEESLTMGLEAVIDAQMKRGQRHRYESRIRETLVKVRGLM